MDTMTDTSADHLHVSTVDVKPINIEWTGDEYGAEYGTGPASDYWEAFTYDLDGTDWTLIAHGAGVEAVVIDGQPFERWSDYAELVDEPMVTEDQFSELLAVEPYEHGAEGPMMNYWYPIEESSGRRDPIAAAAAVDHLPVCVVEVEGEYGLALTGGGMDLSWEVCAAFVALGKLPPVHFSDLPAYATAWTERHETVYAAMRRSLEVMAQRSQYGLERLATTRQQMTKRS